MSASSPQVWALVADLDSNTFDFRDSLRCLLVRIAYESLWTLYALIVGRTIVVASILPNASDEMTMTQRKPATVGDILTEEFMKPLGLTQTALAKAMGVQRKHVNELCNDRRNVTASTALILARVFGNSVDFWLNVQRRTDLWVAMNDAHERRRIERARPLSAAA